MSIDIRINAAETVSLVSTTPAGYRTTVDIRVAPNGRVALNLDQGIDERIGSRLTPQEARFIAATLVKFAGIAENS